MGAGGMERIWIVAAVACCGIDAAFAQDIQAGDNSFKKCLPCHAVGENAKNKFGPQLNGLDGRKIGTAAGYRHSDRYKNFEIIWDEASFTAYISDPKSMVPSPKMTFVGIKNEKEARDLWAYLATFNTDGTRK
jgi:cytochrome c